MDKVRFLGVSFFSIGTSNLSILARIRILFIKKENLSRNLSLQKIPILCLSAVGNRQKGTHKIINRWNYPKKKLGQKVKIDKNFKIYYLSFIYKKIQPNTKTLIVNIRSICFNVILDYCYIFIVSFSIFFKLFVKR